MSDYRELEAEMREAAKDMQEIAELGGTLWWTTCADALADIRTRLEKAERERDEAQAEVEYHKSDQSYIIGWNSGWDEAFLRLKFPVMLRKMWSGGEVQAWLDERRNEQTGPAPGTLSAKLADARAALTRARLEGRIEGMEAANKAVDDALDWAWWSGDVTKKVDLLITAARAKLEGMK